VRTKGLCTAARCGEHAGSRQPEQHDQAEATANLTACILVLLACSACRAGGGARACAGRPRATHRGPRPLYILAEMDNDATEQHRRAMDDQHIEDSAPHGRLYAAEADGGLVHDPVADEYDRATLNMLFAADGVAMETDKQQRYMYIQTAVVGLLRPKGLPGPVDGARAQAQGVADVASADTGGHRAPGAVRM
jgi:hypothetical protein